MAPEDLEGCGRFLSTRLYASRQWEGLALDRIGSAEVKARTSDYAREKVLLY